MLMPKKVKHRRVMKGRMRGVATRGDKINFGDFCGSNDENEMLALILHGPS